MRLVTQTALVLATAIVGLASGAAIAQEYPVRPIRFVIPFPPGGSTDTLGRILGQKLTERWGQQVIIENKPGGNTLIGAELAAKSAPDGYTLFMPIDSTLTMNQALYSKLPYDPANSFAPVTLLTRQSLLIAAHPSLPVNSLRELVDYARANPGKVNYATGAITSQVAGELFKSMAGIDIVNVRYKGSSPTQQAVLAGDVELAIGDIGPYIPLLKAGKLKALATTAGKRAQSLPDVPTVDEQGYPGYEVPFWYGLVVVAGTPKPIVDKLSVEVGAVLNLPDIKQRLAAFGLEVNPTTPEEFAAVVKRESEKWGKVIRAAGIRLD